MLTTLWLIPLAPLIGFFINGLFGLWKVARTGSGPKKSFVY